MHFAKYAFLATALATTSTLVNGVAADKVKDAGQNMAKKSSAIPHVDGGRVKGQPKIAALWKSPLFKAPPGQLPGLAPLPSLGPLDVPPSSPPAPPSPGSSHTPSSSSPSHQSPTSTQTLQENFQIHEPAPILTPSLHSCSVTLVDRSFANSYGSPSYLSFDPQSSFAGSTCSDPSAWTGLSLDLHGETRGRQFDRLGTVWVGNNRTGQGVEVFRFDNPEPTRIGVYWDVRKDVGKYFGLFSERADIGVDLPNIVDSTYTGALNVTLKLTASVDGSIPRHAKGHRRRARLDSRQQQQQQQQQGRDADLEALPLKERAADVVIPLSKRLQTNNSIFQVGGKAGNGTTSVNIPQNAARAIVEVYASGTASEEFWYTGLPDKFYNQIPDAASDGYYGKGPYREVQLYIDGHFAGFVTPYPVIFTGGINPLLWRPSANYGTFDQPTYNIDITPWLGQLTDNQPHTFELAVVSSESDGHINDASWFVSGNVQVYLDESEARTTGKVIKVEKGAEYVDGFVRGKLAGDPLGNGTLTYDVGLNQPRSFGVAGTIKTGSWVEYVAGWYQNAEYDNRGFVNASTQTNDQKSWGWTRSLVLDDVSGLQDQMWEKMVAGSFDDLRLPQSATAAKAAGGVQAVQLDYNYPLYITSSLTDTAFDAQVKQQFDRLIRRTIPPSPADPNAALKKMVGDETTFVHSNPVAALPHTISSERSEDADSVLQDGAIASGSGTSQQTFLYRDMAGGTIDRVTKTNTTSVLQDALNGSIKDRAQPSQLVVA